MSFLSNMLKSFMHPEAGYQKAEDEINKSNQASQGYYNQAQGSLQPYNDVGQQISPQLQKMMQMLADPAALENQWSQGYSESPYAKQLEKESNDRGNEEASSMGLSGSSAALHNNQNNATNIMQGDRQNYMNDMMQKFMQSIGLGENLYGVGAGAAGGQSQNAMGQATNALRTGENLASTAYGKQNAPGAMFSDILGKSLPPIINWMTGGANGASTVAGLAAPFGA